MHNLTANDINLSVDHTEPRMRDIRLAEALGFAQLRDIRKMIIRHKNALEAFGTVFCATVAQNAKRGRPSKEYWLNEKQALYLCTKSEAANAIEITIQMVEVFHAAKTGKHYAPVCQSKFVETWHFEGEPVRVLTNNHHRPLFVAKDVASAMGFQDTRNAILKRCCHQTTLGEYLRHAPPAILHNHLARTLPSQTVLIDEGDVYRLGARSILPAAPRFCDWLRERLLPTIHDEKCYPIVETSPPPISAKSLEYISSFAKAGVNRYDRLSQQMRIVRHEMQTLECLIGQMYDPVAEISLHAGRYANSSRVEELSAPPPHCMGNNPHRQ